MIKINNNTDKLEFQLSKKEQHDKDGLIFPS